MPEQNQNFEEFFQASPETEQKRGPVYKLKKEVKSASGEKEIREFVSVAGIELAVNTEGRGTQFSADEFDDFALDETAMKLLQIFAKAIKLNQPPLVEGPTDIGKSKALEYLAFLTNNYLIYQKEYFKRTGKHLDEQGATWFPESTRPLSGRVPGGGWYPGGGQLNFDSLTRDYRNDFLGCRLAGSFEVNL